VQDLEQRILDLEYVVFGNPKTKEKGVKQTVDHIEKSLDRQKSILTGVAIGVGVQLVGSIPDIISMIARLFSGM
jgi:hypothetical protein